MKNKVIIAVIVVILIIFAGVVGYFYRGAIEETASTNSGVYREVEKNQLVKDNFSVTVPDGWREMAAPVGVSAMVVNTAEKITDPAAQKINFQTYYSISYDVLGGKTGEEYVSYLKDSLKQILPDINFIGDYPQNFDGREVLFIESEVVQRGIDFTLISALFRGANNDMWIISLNTTKDKASDYKDLFEDIVKSFKLK